MDSAHSAETATQPAAAVEGWNDCALECAARSRGGDKRRGIGACVVLIVRVLSLRAPCNNPTHTEPMVAFIIYSLGWFGYETPPTAATQPPTLVHCTSRSLPPHTCYYQHQELRREYLDAVCGLIASWHIELVVAVCCSSCLPNVLFAMFRNLASRVVAPRLLATARTVPISRMTTSQQTITRLATVRSFATATASASSASPTADYVTPPEFQLSPEEKNQSDWEQWDQAKMNVYVLSAVVGGVLLVNYWSATTQSQKHTNRPQHTPSLYAFFPLNPMCCHAAAVCPHRYRREYDHFKHHRHQQEPYAFFIKRDDVVAAGFWPGRACQFLEFNCFAATYDAAEKMLQEKAGGPHDDKEHH